MCPHSTHLRRCSHHPPTAEHSTQPVPLGLAAGLMPSLSEFIYTAPMLIGWRNALFRPPVCDVRQGFHASRRTRAPQALLALVRAKAMPLAWSARRKILAAIAPP